MKQGCQVVLDLMLPGELFFLISTANGYEFRSKSGIAEFINDSISRRSQPATDFSSIIIPRDNSVTHMSGEMIVNPVQPDAVSKASSFKKRTLSIAADPAKMNHLPEQVAEFDVKSRNSSYLNK